MLPLIIRRLTFPFGRIIAAIVTGNRFPTHSQDISVRIPAKPPVDEIGIANYERLAQYKQLLLASPDYRWLEARLEAYLGSERPKMQGTENALRPIIEAYCLRKALPGHSPISASFHLQLNIAKFLKGEHYRGQIDDDVLMNIITLTSDGECHQTTSCAEYVRQTWPRGGEDVLEALVGSLSQRRPTKGKKSPIEDELQF